ncbi:MAG: type II secretion system F family protein [Acidimicrobiia bacterium]|nr:type II secretion system F family protein [Acidimicrobiia bacterium]
MDQLLLAAGSVFLVLFAFAFWVGLGVVRVREAATDRLAMYGRNALREETLSKPVSERAIAPIFIGLGRGLARFTPVGWLKRTQKRLIFAGSPGTLDANAWAVIKLLGVAAGLGLFFLAVSTVDLTIGMTLLMLAFALILGFFGPDAWLTRKIDERRALMQRALPDVLDLLVISVEAGLGFDSALSRVVATVPGPLSEEFFRMLQETRVGVTRRDAMRHLTDRTDLDELRSFILSMMQAEAFGVTISRVLRVQADEMRVKRRQRAQEKAFAAPVKLVFPLVFCIFPSLFIVLLGPAALQIWDNFINL